jgi:hypothetical protein
METGCSFEVLVSTYKYARNCDLEDDIGVIIFCPLPVIIFAVTLLTDLTTAEDTSKHSATKQEHKQYQ